LRYCTPGGRIAFDEKGAPGTQAAGLYPWYAVPGRAERDLKIVCGHWSTLGLFIGHGVHAIDTGAVWGGKLTALQLDADELRVVQVQGRDVPVSPPQSRQHPSRQRPPQRKQSTNK
jgi:bis(5'-nucleosyl)-tetraphosphatase (symmetrical)